MSKENKTLDLVMKHIWFDKIKSGKKFIEYREVKDYWASKIFKLNWENDEGKSYGPELIVDKVLLSRDYHRKEQMLFEIKGINIVPGKNTDLGIDKPVYAIYLGKKLPLKKEIDKC